MSGLRRLLPRAPRPRVNVANPVLARYLDDLSNVDRIGGEWDALAAAARGMDDVLPVRGPVPPADMNVAIEGMMPSVAAEPFADILRRNDRTRALINSRLDRLTPEQRPGSLGLVGRQADADAYRRRRQSIESDMDLGTRLGLAAGAAALAGGYALKSGDDAEAEAMEAEMAREQEAEMARAMLAALSEKLISGFDPLAEMAADSELPIPLSDSILDLPMPDSDPMPSVRQMLQDSAVPARNLPKTAMGDSFQRILESGVYQLPSPEESAAMSPGPETPVGMNQDMEDLPGPQMRSVRALMAAGIPEGRAMAIIVKGSSMSPDEYRMVTGGRR